MSYDSSGAPVGNIKARDVAVELRARLKPPRDKLLSDSGLSAAQGADTVRSFSNNYRRSWYDRYGRTLTYMDKADGWGYSIEAARAGAAHSYIYHNHPAERADEIAAVEQDAKAAGRGLWGPPCFGATASVPR
jgi:hypothetical protein